MTPEDKAAIRERHRRSQGTTHDDVRTLLVEIERLLDALNRCQQDVETVGRDGAVDRA